MKMMKMNNKFYSGMLVFFGIIILVVFYFFQKNNTANIQRENEDKFKDIAVNIDLEALKFKPLSFPDRECNILNYGAEESGKKLATEAIRQAIDDCAKQGGGKVVIPTGKWKTGAIHLKSNINLYLEDNSQLIFSSNPQNYLPVVFSRFEGMELYNYSPFIYAKDCENVALGGKGEIIGQGEKWNDWNDKQKSAVNELYDMADKDVPVEKRIFGTEKAALRPNFIEFVGCRNVEISGLTIIDGPMWTLHPLYSENVYIHDLNIKTKSHNTDGVVIDSSKNVLVENCKFETGDDAVSIKSGLDNDGWRVGRSSENIVIRKISTKRGHGSVNIGSEMSGGVKNVLVYDCDFFNTQSGVRIKTLRGRGGFVENATFYDIRMLDVNDPIIMDLRYPAYTVTPKTKAMPNIKNILFSDINSIASRNAIFIRGFSEKDNLSEISFKNISMKALNGVLIDGAENLKFENIDIDIEVKKDKSLVSVSESFNLIFKKIKCNDNIEICFRILGEELGGIDLKESGISNINERMQFTQDEKFFEN
ncbi:MAG: glycoside hydrolase [Parcubacteria group bacterium Athens0714_25]|nr:MAG: glycoside hydrolase [Parcubacteria group bacterium Athens0714_25]